MHKHCFINFSFIVCTLKLCILRNHEKRKRNTGIAIFEITSEFEKKLEKMRLHIFICLLMAYRFLCVRCFIPKNSFMFNFNKTDAHICFTEYVC